MVDEITMTNTVNTLENIFQKIKDSKKGIFVYDEIFEELSQEIIKKFPDCQKNVPLQVNENHMNQRIFIHFIINSIPVCITNNEQGMAPNILSNIMHVLACKIGISINIINDYVMEYTPLQNSNYTS